MGTSNFPREFQLVVSCCRATFIRDASWLVFDPGINWQRFLRLVRFHRVQGLVWSSLRARADDVPRHVSETLSREATLIAAANLIATAESSALAEIFARQDIRILFLKGLTLGRLAYGTTAIKSAVDIDILVEEDHLHEAASLLCNRGYHLIEPGGRSPANFAHWHVLRKESLWYRPEGNLQIDLHTRVADNILVIPSIGIHTAQQQVEVSPGVKLPTLATDELFAYLCVHGASSSWFRLKWITDLAAILSSTQEGEIPRLYRASQKLGAGRSCSQALLLADRFYEVLIGNQDLRQELRKDYVSRWLFSTAVKQLVPRPEPREPTSSPLGTLMIHLAQLALLPGWAYKREEVRRQFRAGVDRVQHGWSGTQHAK